MEEKFVIEGKIDRRERTEIIRVLMGKAYFLFLLVAGLVICYNYYMISTGQNVEGDGRKTIILFVLMLIWALIPVVGGIIWNCLSKIKDLKVTVLEDRLVIATNIGTRELPADKFDYVMERENYIKVGSLKEGVILNKNNVKVGEADKLAKYLRDMKK